MPRLAATTIALLTCAVALAGCGGDDGDSGGGSGSDAKRVTIAEGETATFKGPNEAFDVAIDVEAVEGKIEDLKDFNLEEGEEEMTPWYVTHTFENRGDDLTADDAFAAVVEAYDDSGTEPKEIMPLGDFEPCELVNVPDPFEAGATHSSCDIYLLEPGSTLDELVVTETRFEGDSIDHVWKVD